MVGLSNSRVSIGLINQCSIKLLQAITILSSAFLGDGLSVPLPLRLLLLLGVVALSEMIGASL